MVEEMKLYVGLFSLPALATAFLVTVGASNIGENMKMQVVALSIASWLFGLTLFVSYINHLGNRIILARNGTPIRNLIGLLALTAFLLTFFILLTVLAQIDWTPAEA